MPTASEKRCNVMVSSLWQYITGILSHISKLIQSDVALASALEFGFYGAKNNNFGVCLKSKDFPVTVILLTFCWINSLYSLFLSFIFLPWNFQFHNQNISNKDYSSCTMHIVSFHFKYFAKFHENMSVFKLKSWHKCTTKIGIFNV